MNKYFHILTIFTLLCVLDSSCYPIDIQELNKTGHSFSLTYSKGIYNLAEGKHRYNAVGYGYFMRAENALLGIYKDSKYISEDCIFIVMPDNESLLINLLKSWREKNKK